MAWWRARGRLRGAGRVAYRRAVQDDAQLSSLTNATISDLADLGESSYGGGQ